MKSADIRKAFLEFFAQKGHQVVPSSSLVPSNDPTLLFTNAGMVQFKDVFLGRDHRDYNRATTSQRCVRAGGKHNDLDNVGYTARHHTFFEMLGNFSFGDYFKREAIQFCWEFLTEVMKFPSERLWVTVHLSDDEAADIWLNEIKVDPKRFSRCDEDNFWAMGDIGPCGPCTEVFYDHGEHIPGGPPGSEGADLDRYIEIWNLVFMQYDRSADGTLTPLPKPSVDTGMGLERLSAVMQNVHNNYDTDLFVPILQEAAKLTETKDLQNNSLRVLADHIRSTAFLIVDGVVASNEGRGYVLRRIIRRACRHGHHLGLDEPFFYKLVQPLIDVMREAYPELQENKKLIEQSLKKEEQQFLKTLDLGMGILSEHLQTMQGKEIAGTFVFKLYDTYGFPADLTADIARERDLTVDMDGFDKCMKEQQERSQQAGKFKADYHDAENVDTCSDFVGYTQLQQQSTVTDILIAGKKVEFATAGDDVAVVLASTPFYAESGGQVGDCGVIGADGLLIQVQDTQKQGDAVLHFGHVEQGELKVGLAVEANVNQAVRQATILNHSATHLLHEALRRVLGKHVTQKGSLVAPDKLRFDFTHNQAVTKDELCQVEAMVNLEIRNNLNVATDITTPDEAKKRGAMALFGEKYGEQVRVLSMGEFSIELCGGTHVARTGDIGVFKIILETSIASGVRRIEALTGEAALQCFAREGELLQQVAGELRTDKENVLEKLERVLKANRSQEKQIAELQMKLASGGGKSLADGAVEVTDIKVLAQRIDGVDMKTLRETLDNLKQKMTKAVIVLGSVEQDKVRLVAGVTKNCVTQVHAGELINFIAGQVGGKGGGRPDMAQAGGDQPGNLGKALDSVVSWVTEQLNH